MKDFFQSVWSGMTPGIQSAVIGATATIVTATLGALLVVWQIARQAKNARRQTRETEALKLKLKLYEEIASYAGAASNAEGALKVFVLSAIGELKLFHDAQRDGKQWSVPTSRVTTLLSHNAAFNEASGKLFTAVERWEIIDRRLEVFRLGFAADLHEVRDAFFAFHQAALPAFPMERDKATGELFPWSPPSGPKLAELERLGDNLMNCLGDYGGHVYDFQIETQNLLLGELFRPPLPPRVPLDPKVVVIRLDRFERLRDYFLQETTWGKQNQAVNKRVAAMHKGASG